MPKNKSNRPIVNSSNRHPTRPPVVVVLGHIDHGKTTLLDYIRSEATKARSAAGGPSIRVESVAAKEAGGITQRIGAYQIEIGQLDKQTSGKGDKRSNRPAIQSSNRLITFIDTPGHAAFAKMRARGADVADVAVLVVAADDGVMPQTKEAIAHAKAAGIPLVVAINKSDLKSADPKKAERQLIKEGIVPEGQGGDVPVVNVSAKTGQGVPELLEMVCLVADMLELKADPNAPFGAVVIETSLSPQQGPTATLLVKEGTLRNRGVISAGGVGGRVRALIDEHGQRLKEASPGMPVVVLGFSDVVPVGTTVTGKLGDLGSGKKDQATHRPSNRAAQVSQQPSSPATDLNVVLRADTQGSLEAISDTLSRLDVGGKRVTVLLAGVGRATDSDIYLAQSADGVVLGFNVGGSTSVKKLADDLGVGLRFFTIIYELLEMVEKLLKGVSELEKAKIKGEGEVIKTFALHSGDVVLGVRVTVGRIKYRNKVKVLRGEEEVGQGQVSGLKVGEDEVAEVKEGDEAGILIKPRGEFKKKDRIVVL